MGHCVESHRSAIAPSPNAHAVAIELGILSEELIENCELVFEFNPAELMTDCGHKLAVAAGGAAIVYGENRESSLGHQLMEKTVGSGPVLDPAVGHGLRGRAAVDVYDQRILPADVLSGGSTSSP